MRRPLQAADSARTAHDPSTPATQTQRWDLCEPFIVGTSGNSSEPQPSLRRASYYTTLL